MSKVSAHRHVASWAKHVMLGWLFASFCASLGCSARATGTEDIIAISHRKSSSSRTRPSTTNRMDGAAGSMSEELIQPSDDEADDVSDADSESTAAKSGDTTNDSSKADSPDDSLGTATTLNEPSVGAARDVPRQTVLFWVDAVSSRVWRANADGDGSDRRLLASALSISAPDGITVDLTDGFVYWTNMGTPVGGAGIGSLQRMKLDDEVVETVIPVGTTRTPKQISIDNQSRKLYWSDREAAVWRSELDGADPEVILTEHGLMQPVGIGLDVDNRQIYISDRYTGKLMRVGFDMPEGEAPDTRSDVETLVSFTTTAVPLNIALDLESRKLYWTDRYRGTIYRMDMDLPPNATAEDRTDMEVVLDGLNEPVGLAFDEVTKRLYFSELSGRVSRCNLDGSDQNMILMTASASGIALAHLPE